MAFPPDRRLDPQSSLLRTLSYSSQFSFPLTLTELWLWQLGTSFPPSKFSFWPHQAAGYYYLPGRKADIITRRARILPSQRKQAQAQKISRLLRRLPTIQAIYLTGSAAVNNSSDQDDIDLMIITSQNCVWVTRLLVFLILSLFSLRRPFGHPEHSSHQVADKICDNLYLDESSLTQVHHPANPPRSLYLAHEILQAVPLWSRHGLSGRFLLANSWTREYLPVIYRHLHRQLKPDSSPSAPARLGTFILNLCFFLPQYLYMRPHLTNESIGLHSAFFHPHPRQA